MIKQTCPIVIIPPLPEPETPNNVEQMIVMKADIFTSEHDQLIN